MLQLRRRFTALHLAQRQHRVPEGEFPPTMFAVAYRLQMQRAAPQSLFPAIEATGEHVSPHAYAALAAAVEPRIAFARVLGCAGETSEQALVGGRECTRDAAVLHS